MAVDSSRWTLLRRHGTAHSPLGDLPWGGISDTMVYLYGLKRASSLMIDHCFERVSSSDVVKLLLENEAISDSSIVAAFRRAAFCYSNEHVEIVKLLYRNTAITSDAIDKAFASAAGLNRTNVIELLQNDDRLTRKGVDEGLVNAVKFGQEEMVKVLYEQHQISPSGLLKALKRAVYDCHSSLVKVVMEYLSAENVPREYKLKAFLYAAEQENTRALEIIVDFGSGDWTIDELKAARSVARSPKVKQFIRKAISDQLSRGRP